MTTIYVILGFFMFFTILTFMSLFRITNMLKQTYEMLLNDSSESKNEIREIWDRIKMMDRNVLIIIDQECNKIIDMRFRDEELRN